MAVTSRDRVGARTDRREELVRAARELVRDASLDELDAAAVAEAAGVSKPLVYYYFPTHRDLQAAVVEAAAHELLARIRAVDPRLSRPDQLRAGLDTAIEFIEQQPTAYTALARSAGYHPKLQEAFERARDAVVDLLAERLGVTDPSPGQRICLRSWIALVEEAVLHWIVSDRPVPRVELVAYCHDLGLHILTTRLAAS